MEQTNNNIATLIKLRHLSKALKSNWELLHTTKYKTNDMLQEANNIMQVYGTEEGKQIFQQDLLSMNEIKASITEKLEQFKNRIDGKNTTNNEILYQEFLIETEALSALFDGISTYKDSYFNGINQSDWLAIWTIIKSNLYTINGIGAAAFTQLQMYEEFSTKEIDELSQEIIKYIPDTYNIEDALKYKKEYLVALQQIEDEANQKANLWDRFLNLVAGNVPFRQSPQDRVFMMRWLEGERGDLTS